MTQPSLEPLASLVKQAQHRQNRAMEAALAPLGLSLVQWNALREIDRHPGATLNRLADLTFISEQAFGALAGRMIREDLLARRPGVGRASIHELTARGREQLAAGAPLIAQAARDLFAALDEAERGVLEGVLVKVLRGPKIIF